MKDGLFPSEKIQVKEIKGTQDFEMAIEQGHLKDAEEFMKKEKEAGRHPEHELVLGLAYIHHNDLESARRILDDMADGENKRALKERLEELKEK